MLRGLFAALTCLVAGVVYFTLWSGVSTSSPVSPRQAEMESPTLAVILLTGKWKMYMRIFDTG